MSTQDGGPAFPLEIRQEDSAGVERTVWQGTGMSVWDYFAAKALQGIAANPNHVAVDFNPEWEGYEGGTPEEFQQAAHEAGLMADALMAERAKRQRGEHDDD